MDSSRNIVVAFSPTDFYYVTADQSLLENCSPNAISCGDPANINSNDYETCYKEEVCLNKQTAQWIQQMGNKHSGSDQNYQDMATIYSSTLQSTVNLGIGISATLLYIYFNM